MLSVQDQQQVNVHAWEFANKHRDDKFGIDLRRSDIVKAAEHCADCLPTMENMQHRSAREIAVIYQFATKVFAHLGINDVPFI